MGYSAYKILFGDVRNKEGAGQMPTVMSGERLADLLRETFGKIDINGDGVSLREIKRTDAMPFNFSAEALLMLKVLEKYFETLFKISHDDPGPDPVISAEEVEILALMLHYSHITIEQLQEWRKLSDS